jgi:hypothetical protein
VSVNGSFNGWTARTDIMTPNPLNPDVYEVTTTIHAGEGDQIQFKFWYTENNWESVDNRVYSFTANDVTNGTASFEASFNNGTLESVLNQPCTIKLTVNTNGARSAISGNTFPVVNTVHVAGSALPLQWPSGGWPDADSNRVMPLYDDGTNGDATAGDGIFTRNVEFPAYTVLDVQYKYGINWADAANNEGGNDNEAGFGQNHELHMSRYMTSATSVDTFGTMGDVVLTDVIVLSVDDSKPIIPKAYALQQNYPNPFNPRTLIRFAVPKESDVVVKVFDIFGRTVATLVNDHRHAGEYTVEFAPNNLASGIYYYRLSAGSFTETKSMLLLK